MEQATANRKFRTVARQANERSRGNTEQAKKSSAPVPAYGFLNHRFLPVTDGRHDELKNKSKVEREFFKSLSYLAELYRFPLPDVSGQVFPLNICNAFDYAKDRIKNANPDLYLFIFQEDTTILATAKNFNTGTCLYYVSIAPLITLEAEKKYPQLNILLSVFTYLHRITGIPFYHDDSSYIGSQYETLRCWIDEQSDEEEYGRERLQQLQLIGKQGKKFRHKIKGCRHLNSFKRRLERFAPCTETDENLFEVGRCFLQLMNDYPDTGIHKFIIEGLTDPNEEDRIYPEAYLSFMYDYEDCLHEDLFGTISEHLNNCGAIDEPMAFQYFDRQQQAEQHDLDYVNRIFDLLDRLIDLLKSY